MMVAVKLPWSQRIFALPFLSVLAPSKKANQARGKEHKTSVDWARQMCYQLRRWLPQMPIRLVVDGAFATAGLAWTALKLNISLISRLRLDARIFDFPEVKSGPGRPAKRGRRLLAPKALMIEEFVKRWAIEVTFREVREHLGVETQRQWSDKAIARETPALFALYSIIILIGLQLGQIPVRTAAWYSKQSNTFSDILVEVRRILWRERYFVQVTENEDLKEILTQNGLMAEIVDHLAEAL
jgi:hypothetical protein